MEVCGIFIASYIFSEIYVSNLEVDMYYEIETKWSETDNPNRDTFIGIINASLISIPLWVLILLSLHWLF
jgi:hypothetical protein